MSRSLSRVRNLITEIEEIQRQGQQGGRSALERTVSFKSDEIPKSVANVPLVDAAPPQPKIEAVKSPVVEVPKEPVVETVNLPPQDPFEDLDEVVRFDSKRPAPAIESVQAGKVFVQLSGHVALQLQIEDSPEVLALQQIGNMLEIRFPDGKAFHIPINSVA